MKNLFSAIAVIAVIAACGMVMTACTGSGQTSGEASDVQSTSAVQETTVSAETTTASAEASTVQQTTAVQKNEDDKKSSETESKAAENSGGTFAGISEEDAKVMALLDLVTEDPSVESCKQGKDKNGADCWVIILKDADNDRYISYVNAGGSTTLPYSE